jgi:hypothetical protein
MASPLIEAWRTAENDPATAQAARASYALFASWCSAKPPRIPGMGTVDRIAMRIHAGKTVEEAATREYLYRWNLAILPPDQCIDPSARRLDLCCSSFGTPHPIGL